MNELPRPMPEHGDQYLLTSPVTRPNVGSIAVTTLGVENVEVTTEPVQAWLDRTAVEALGDGDVEAGAAAVQALFALQPDHAAMRRLARTDQAFGGFFIPSMFAPR